MFSHASPRVSTGETYLRSQHPKLFWKTIINFSRLKAIKYHVGEQYRLWKSQEPRCSHDVTVQCGQNENSKTFHSVIECLGYCRD